MTALYHLRDIRCTYGETPALCIDDLQIEENSVTALLGSNGSGKSTLLNLLAFIKQPAAGDINFAGKKVDSRQLTDYRRQVGYVQQKPYLFNYSVVQNIELGLKLRGQDKNGRRQQVETLAEQLKIEDLLTRRASQLSGGEVQKVAIARALVLQPAVLLLDEPFTHLDEASRGEIENILLSLASSGSQTIVFSTHEALQAQKLASQVCTLVQGRIGFAPQVNAFSGELDSSAHVFKTARLAIHVSSMLETGTKLAIDSTHLVLSRNKLDSSMRNQFKGRVVALREANSEINITVEAGETWQVMITREALSELNIDIGAEVWLSFKSSAVQVF